VRHCIEQGIALEDLGSETLASFAPEFGTDAGDYATLLASVESRRERGGTAPEAVREQLLHAEKLLEIMPAS
jgi:argininosuccinate lyase